MPILEIVHLLLYRLFVLYGISTFNKCKCSSWSKNEANSLFYMFIIHHKMTKKNELNNVYTNNSSAIVAPIRSEIRISVTIPVINFHQILSKVCHAAMASSSVRVAAIVEASALSLIYILELPASIALIVLLSVTCVVAALFSFMGILNELGGYKGILEDIKNE